MRGIQYFTFLLLLALAGPGARAQQLVGYELMKPLDVPVYEPAYPNLLLLMLPTDFAESSFSGSKKINVPEGLEILFLDLVYTEYPAGNNFEALNRRRLLWLAQKLPASCFNANPPVRLVRQTRATNKTDAAKLFHGFAIYYREKPGPETKKKELEYLDKLPTSVPLHEHSTIYPKKGESDTLFYFCYDTVALKWLKKNGVQYEVLTPDEMFRRGLMHPRERSAGYRNCFSFIITRILPPASGPEPYPAPTPKSDQTVWETLKRNRWKNMAVCIDVTASMSGFTAQLLTWLQTNYQEQFITTITAFNDGDDMPDNKKELGSTGGIYTSKVREYADVTQTIRKAMSKGTGGDIPENNIEALLAAYQQAPAGSQLVLIADNWAPVKDRDLLNELKVPVKVILCGVSTAYLQTDYLDIVRATGGSLHTMDNDFTGLAKLQEGEVFIYKNARYRVVNNRFVNESFGQIRKK